MALKPKDRQSEIAALVAHQGEISVETLADTYDVSAETVRRDLARLSEQGRIRKVHGGAKPAQLHSEPSFAERMSEDLEEKQAIGRRLRAELRDGDTVFMDTGSATLIACDALLDMSDLTVITNSVLVAQKLGPQEGIIVYLIGGLYGAGNQQTLGNLASTQIAQFYADHAVLTLSGLDAKAGITYADQKEAEIASAMIRQSEQVTYLVTSSKFGRRSAFRTGGLSDIDTVLTMDLPPEPLATQLALAGVRIPADQPADHEDNNA